MNKIKRIFTATITSITILFCFSCKTTKSTPSNRIVIWTDCSEFAQYVELFNKTHKKDSAVIMYKENPAQSLPPAKDELPPDIVVGSWLKNESTQKNFKSLDYLFDRKRLTSDIFYTQLLESGKIRKSQYLLPVSYNLPALIFSKDNEKLIAYNYTISLEDIRQTSALYNQKNKKDAFTRIGFSPLSNDDFIYLYAKLKNADFNSIKGNITWNQENLDKSVSELKEWITTDNKSPEVEKDFVYKYLAMPYYRQVNSGRTLFAYTTSDNLMKISKNHDYNIDFRWIAEENQLPLEDTFTMMGIYSKARNQVGASEFITWFFQSDNQNDILKRKADFNLDTELFGIAGGFSAVRDVTEHILPIYYNQLLTNLPPANILSAPSMLPPKWISYKTSVIKAYMNAAIESQDETLSILDFEKEWQKKMFE